MDGSNVAVRTVLVRLQADATGYMNAMRTAGSATKLIGAAGLVAGGAVVAGLGMAVKKSAEFESAMSGIKAATQASAGTLDQLRASAMKAGADTQYSATEAANAITEMSKAGVSAKDIMGGGLSGALSLAAAGQLEVADAAGIASVAMTQFNLSGQDLPHVADLLAAGAGKAMGSVEDLGMALKQGGLIASAAGLSIEETTGGLAAFASAGLIGSDAGTSFKTMLQALQAPSGKAANLMSELGLNMYDSQGKMLGLADMAGQLQTHLGGLTEEQRNSALATIFGSDAVRAANVLYKQGAAGIEDWTKKVNDQGYAQKQAAALTDNLSGDLERLGGSFDTLLISIGSGTQGPLRELVQLFTGLLNGAGSLVGVFSSIPGPVLAGVAAFTALAVLRGPLNTMFTQMSVSIMSTVTGLGMATGATSLFGIALAGARTAVAGLITAAAPLAGLIVASYAVKDVMDFVHAGDDATQTVKDMGQAIKDADGNGARFDATTSAIDQLKQKAADAQAAIDKIDNKSYLSKVFLSAFDGDTSALKDNQEALKGYQAALESLQGTQDRAAANVNTLAAQYKLSKDDVIAFADAHGINLSGSLDKTSWDFARLVDSTKQSGDAMINGTGPAEDFQNSLGDVSDAAKDAKKQTDLYKTSLDILNGAHLTAIQAEADFYAAIGAADGALKNEHGSVLDAAGGLDVHSEAGRKTFDVLNGVRDAANQYISTLIEQGASSDEANAKDAQLRKSFYDTALQLTGSKKAADELTNSIYGIPQDRKTTITADTGPAVAAITELVNRSWTTHIGLASANNNTADTNRAGTGKASGGYISGPGSGTSDSIPVNLSNGEYVIRASAVRRVGVSHLDALNNGRPGYANGGLVGDINTIVRTEVDPASLATTAASLQKAADSLSVGPSAGAGVQRWLPVVLQALGMVGQPASLAQTVLRRMNQESGGQPGIVNRWDSNWAKGTPSVGLMQVIGPTYRATRDRRRDVGPYVYGTSVDPLSNLLSSMHYALNRYGSLSAAYNKAGGYANGGTTPANEPFWVGERGPELMWSSREQYVSTAAQSREFSGGVGGRSSSVPVQVAPPQVTVHFHVDGEEFRGMTRTEIETQLDAVTDALTYAGG